jgi:His/Glu/Gln/Arg/opine family amino acid ABC transporter permease subunit
MSVHHDTRSGALDALSDAHLEAGRIKTPRERAKHWLEEQTSISLAVAVVGAFALTLELVGSTLLLVQGGLSRYTDIVATWASDTQWYLLWVSLALGTLATAAGAALYGRMPTKQAREGAIAGAVLGVQALVLSAVYLWFLRGDVELFARNFLKFDVVSQFIGQFVNGAKNTLILAFLGQAIGIALGLMLSLLALSKRSVTRAPARTFINFIRGTPLLWQLQFGFYGIVLGLQLDMNAYQVAILILGLNAGGYTAEIFRAGIQSIERGQLEAARSSRRRSDV